MRQRTRTFEQGFYVIIGIFYDQIGKPRMTRVLIVDYSFIETLLMLMQYVCFER